MTTTTRFKSAEERGTVTVTVCKQEQYDCHRGLFDFGDWEEGSLDRVLESLKAIRESIPEEYRASAHCEIGSESGYEDSHYATIEVGYNRPETDEEWERRVSAMRERAAFDKEHRRQIYESLKGEFEE